MHAAGAQQTGHREFGGSPDDPAVYRIFASFLRGAFEGGLPPTSRLALLDARRIAAVSEAAINLRKPVRHRGPRVAVFSP
jgi:hypothetical protein